MSALSSECYNLVRAMDGDLGRLIQRQLAGKIWQDHVDGNCLRAKQQCNSFPQYHRGQVRVSVSCGC